MISVWQDVEFKVENTSKSIGLAQTREEYAMLRLTICGTYFMNAQNY